MVVPRLGDEADRVRLALEECLHAGIVPDGAAGPLRHSEGGEAGAACPFLREECRVGRVGARIPTFDVIHAETVEHGGHKDLVFQAEIYARRLLAVAERSVEEDQAFTGHHITSQVVPSGPSLSAIPCSASSWRMRSASAKSRRL